MIQRIKTWLSNYKEKRRKKQILKIIKRAKQTFLNGHSPFMCICFYHVESSFNHDYCNIVDKIPEFKPETFDYTYDIPEGSWWDKSDRESRIKAFDKLIEIYSK